GRRMDDNSRPASEGSDSYMLRELEHLRLRDRELDAELQQLRARTVVTTAYGAHRWRTRAAQRMADSHGKQQFCPDPANGSRFDRPASPTADLGTSPTLPAAASVVAGLQEQIARLQAEKLQQAEEIARLQRMLPATKPSGTLRPTARSQDPRYDTAGFLAWARSSDKVWIRVGALRGIGKSYDGDLLPDGAVVRGAPDLDASVGLYAVVCADDVHPSGALPLLLQTLENAADADLVQWDALARALRVRVHGNAPGDYRLFTFHRVRAVVVADPFQLGVAMVISTRIPQTRGAE
ncbi:hypothetical protein OAO87_04360, partial [bacterium]|nr:hypothetical protein [bacterium]